MSRCQRFLIAVCVWGIAMTTAVGQDNPTKKPTPGIDRKKLEKEFAEKLSGVALVGRFSITTSEKEPPAKPDRYVIDKVTKLPKDYWMFHYRKSPDFVLPIALKVVWAGDTPMITMSDVNIPTMGTFSARIMFHGNLYAGTWQHGKVGGHMWGKLEKLPKKSEKNNDATDKQ